jgi:hypothetical protein
MALPSNIAQIQASHPYMGPIIAEALMCLCDAASRLPNPPQHCTFRIGNQPPHDLGLNGDLCCEGFAYVSLGNVFPSSEGFPQEDGSYQAGAVCAPLSWGIPLKLGIVRCAPVSTDGVSTVPDSEWEAAMLQNIYDTSTLLTAACCLRAYVIRANDSRWLGMSEVTGNVNQGEPLGGCVERSIDVQVQMPNCNC